MASVVFVRKAELLKGESKISGEGRTEQRIYLVHMDGKPGSRDEVLATNLIPTRGTPFKVGDTRLADEITVANGGTVQDYIVTVDYKTPDGSTSSPSNNPNPLMRPDRVSVTGASQQQKYFKDFTDDNDGPRVVTSSAGEVFQDLPQNFVGSLQLVIKGNRASADLATWATYLRPACAINSDAFSVKGYSVGVGQACLLNYRLTEVEENDVTYLEVEWTILLADTFDQKVLDRGTWELDDDGYAIPITLDNGIDLTQPWPLDGSGVGKAYADDDPAELTFKPQPKKAFGIFTWTA